MGRRKPRGIVPLAAAKQLLSCISPHATSSDIHGGGNTGLPSGFQDSFSWPYPGVGMIRGQ